MQNIQIGCGQITWYSGVDQRPSEAQVLAEIARAGYAGAPAGPHKTRSVQETLDLFAAHNLVAAPGYFSADFQDIAQEQDILQRARDHASFAQQAGLTELYVAAHGFDGYATSRGLTRRQVSGNVRPEDAMSNAEFEQFAHVLNQVGQITLAQGVRSCFHNHVGSTIETRAEIDRLFDLVDRSAVFMGPDTGHLAWAGADVLQFLRDYADSIHTIHIKDVQRSVLEEGVAQGWDYGTFSKHGIWTELGQGFLDFPAIFDILGQAGFEGWIIVETDVTQLASPLESAVVSRAYLRSLGY